MKRIIFSLLAGCSLTLAEGIDMNKLSETLGHLLHEQLSTSDLPVNIERVVEGLQKAHKGEPSPLTAQEYEQQFALLQREAMSKKADTNLTQANEFLEKNALKEGISCVLPGLQYKTLAKGAGKTVAEGATPVLHYTGKFIDGTVFSTSVNGEPLSLPLSQTIEGFRKGIVGMQEGEKRVLYIHPELGYGTQKNPNIPPNSLLIFEIEILKAEKDSK